MKGDRNEEIRQNELFCAFQTFALPTDRPTDMTSYRSARTHLKIMSTVFVYTNFRLQLFCFRRRRCEGGRVKGMRANDFMICLSEGNEV